MAYFALALEKAGGDPDGGTGVKFIPGRRSPVLSTGARICSGSELPCSAGVAGRAGPLALGGARGVCRPVPLTGEATPVMAACSTLRAIAADGVDGGPGISLSSVGTTIGAGTLATLLPVEVSALACDGPVTSSSKRCFKAAVRGTQ